MSTQKVSDSEFIHIWLTSPSAQVVADKTGVCLRQVMRRRRRIEELYGPLPALQAHKNLVISETSRPLTLLGSAIIFGDAHWWPNVPSPATDILCQIAEDIKPKAFIANGDLMDNATNSRHSRIGWDSRPSLGDELGEVKKRMKQIMDSAPDAKRFWTWGNHDIRYDTFLANHAGLYQGIESMTLESHFPEWNFCWSVNVNNECVVKHRFTGSKHASYNNTLRAGTHMVTGHTHRLNVRALSDFNGTRYGVEHGTLCAPTGPQLDYAEHNPLDMQEGFIVMTVDEMGMMFEPVFVLNGRAKYNGKVYR